MPSKPVAATPAPDASPKKSSLGNAKPVVSKTADGEKKSTPKETTKKEQDEAKAPQAEAPTTTKKKSSTTKDEPKVEGKTNADAAPKSKDSSRTSSNSASDTVMPSTSSKDVKEVVPSKVAKKDDTVMPSTSSKDVKEVVPSKVAKKDDTNTTTATKSVESSNVGDGNNGEDEKVVPSNEYHAKLDTPAAAANSSTSEGGNSGSLPASRKTSGAEIRSSKVSSRASSTKKTRGASEESTSPQPIIATSTDATKPDAPVTTKASTKTSKNSGANSAQPKKGTAAETSLKSKPDKKDATKKPTEDKDGKAGGKPPVASKSSSTKKVPKSNDLSDDGGHQSFDAVASELATSAIEGALRTIGNDQLSAPPANTTKQPSKLGRVPTLSISSSDGGVLGGGGFVRRSASHGGSISALIEVGRASSSSHREISALTLSTSKTTYVGPPTGSLTSPAIPAAASKDKVIAESEPTPETTGAPIAAPIPTSSVRNPYTLASKKNKRTALERMMMREESIQALIEKHEEDAIRNKELWRERATLARLQAAEKQFLRVRANGRRAVDATNESGSLQRSPGQQPNHINRGGAQFPSMWGAPISTTKKAPRKKGDRNPAGFISSSEEDDGDFSHLTPEDAHSRMILKRARRADRRRRREEEERREAVLAARTMQRSQYVPSALTEASRNPDGASFLSATAHATPTTTTPLRDRVLKEVPLTGEQERKMHHERRRQVREYAEATRLAEAALPKKLLKVKLPALDKNARSPSTLSNPAPQKLEAVRRGNDNMRAVAREQRERREKALAAKQDGEGEQDTSQTAPPKVLTDVDVDAQLQEAARRKKMHDLGCGYLREQRDAFERRKPNMDKREKSKQERQEEVDRAAQELKELKRIGHRLHAAELYGRQGKKQPYTNLPSSDTGAEASTFTTTVLPPIKRAVPATTADPEDILIKSAQAKIKMLQLLQSKANNNSSTTTSSQHAEL